MVILFVDGPARGTVRDIPSSPYIMLAIKPENIPNAVDFEQIVYHVHKFIICGRMLRLASTHTLVDDIDESAVYDLIVSDVAKECADAPNEF
jgi:hypothetical protein